MHRQLRVERGDFAPQAFGQPARVPDRAQDEAGVPDRLL
jgi:hypothetical protein